MAKRYRRIGVSAYRRGPWKNSKIYYSDGCRRKAGVGLLRNFGVGTGSNRIRARLERLRLVLNRGQGPGGKDETELVPTSNFQCFSLRLGRVLTNGLAGAASCQPQLSLRLRFSPGGAMVRNWGDRDPYNESLRFEV